MKAFKIAAIVVVGLWMAWVTMQLYYIRKIALEACGIAAAHGMDTNGGIHVPVVCPDLNIDEIKPR